LPSLLIPRNLWSLRHIDLLNLLELINPRNILYNKRRDRGVGAVVFGGFGRCFTQRRTSPNSITCQHRLIIGTRTYKNQKNGFLYFYVLTMCLFWNLSGPQKMEDLLHSVCHPGGASCITLSHLPIVHIYIPSHLFSATRPSLSKATSLSLWPLDSAHLSSHNCQKPQCRTCSASIVVLNAADVNHRTRGRLSTIKTSLRSMIR